MGKTRYAPSTRRFAKVVSEPAVYFAELSKGVLKVGACTNARYRMMSLRTEVIREQGLELHRFHVVPAATAKAAYELETILVKCLIHIANRVPGRREYFTGITFDGACKVFGLRG